MKLCNITNEHIKELASFLSITDDEITEIRRAPDLGWVILYWHRKYNNGRIFVSNDEVYFSDDDGKEQAGFLEIQCLLDLGYEIFKKKGD